MISTKNRILFRADGNHTIGLGHVVRSMALADLLKVDFEIVFICRGLPFEQKETIISKHFRLIELNTKNVQDEIFELENILIANDILVLDGYLFDFPYQIKVKEMVKKLVMIDDLADRKLITDLIINHGGEFIANKYDLETNSKILTGFKYLLVRKEFLQGRSERKRDSKIESVFICMGGADPFNVTPKVLKACIDSKFVKKIVVVVGLAFTNFDEIKEIVNSTTEIEIQIENNVDAQKMVQLISDAQIAICPSSSIALEVCCIGCGILTGIVVDNQSAIHEQIVKNNCGITLGNFNEASITDIVNFLNKLNDLDLINSLIQNQKDAIVSSDENYLLEEFKLLSDGN